jgi:putative heme iron utilization protein
MSPDQTDGQRGGGLGRAARALLAAESVGILCTTSVHRAGYPYGSLTPYALPPAGTPLLLLSALAAHTHNLLADPRACLFVGDRGAVQVDDPQAGRRLSLLGRAAVVPEARQPEARAAYLARWPRAEVTLGMHDFALWELEVEEARFVAGFGQMGWLDAAALR